MVAWAHPTGCTVRGRRERTGTRRREGRLVGRGPRRLQALLVFQGDTQGKGPAGTPVPLLGESASERGQKQGQQGHRAEQHPPCPTPAGRQASPPPQPPIKAALGRVTSHRDRQLQSAGAAASAKAVKLVGQLSQRQRHTARTHRRYTPPRAYARTCGQ